MATKKKMMSTDSTYVNRCLVSAANVYTVVGSQKRNDEWLWRLSRPHVDSNCGWSVFICHDEMRKFIHPECDVPTHPDDPVLADLCTTVQNGPVEEILRVDDQRKRTLTVYILPHIGAGTLSEIARLRALNTRNWLINFIYLGTTGFVTTLIQNVLSKIVEHF